MAMPVIGSYVKLTSRPAEVTSNYAQVTVGQVYKVIGHHDQCLVVTSDEPCKTATIYHGRFRAEIHPPADANSFRFSLPVD